MKDNIKKNLSDLNIKGHIGKEYIYDIFKKQIQSEKVPGLVDCSNAEEFNKKFELKKALWVERHIKLYGLNDISMVNNF